jgi:hypothetical protein
MKSSLSTQLLRMFLSGALFAGGAAYGQAPPETVAPKPAQGPTTAPANAPDAQTPAPPNTAPATPAGDANRPAVAPAPGSAATDKGDTSGDASGDTNADSAVNPATLLPAVPSLPPQKASLIGGTVEKMDRVRDELTIRVFGGGKMKIAFDPRTTILKNGETALPSDLKRGDHVSIDTILNGGTVFARNIRLTTSIPGESQGTVVSYQDAGRELDVRDRLSPRVLKLRLTPQTRVIDEGKDAAPAELVRGTLVSIRFGPLKDGRNTVDEITVLAVPGRSFTFVGHVTNLDLRAGLIVLTSATDGKTYEISFDPSEMKLEDSLAQAADVTVITQFDGSRYVARSVKIN